VLDRGAIGFLLKPFNAQSLIECIDNALERRGGEIGGD
jgi:FixJ family two-component response regulator